MPDQFDNEVSVVIVNYDHVDTTVKSVECVQRSEGGFVREILVVDNGSSPGVLAELRQRIRGRARLVELGTNRYFGEGNNIGVEEASGQFVLLLNNDAYVEPGCISALVSSLQRDPSVAAVGPMFLYPTGAVQEVGGMVLETGDVVQVGKGAVWGPDHYTEECAVDYCSAACLLMRKADFIKAKGFSLQWEPAYYEDVDLCLTLWAEAGPVIVNPLARVTHLESLTTSDARMRLESQVEINRLTFVQKWGEWLRAKQRVQPAGVLPPLQSAERRDVPAEGGAEQGAHRSLIRDSIDDVVLFTKYEVVPGGGERVLFELASVLVEAIGSRQVSIATPFRYSDIRMRQLADTFGVDGPESAITLDELEKEPPDMCVVLGNEVVPPIPAHGRKLNIYVCQFPFDAPDDYVLRNGPHLAKYDEIWVYSDFVRHYVNGHLRHLGLPTPDIRVMHPPATLPAPPDPRPWPERRAVMTVGRFFRGGHDKRQDVVIDIVRQLAERFGRPVPLVVAGSLHASPESRERFRELVELSEGIDCSFYPNASRAQLLELYATSAVLVHAAGYDVDRYSFPERLEHFGIVPLEAASVGCIPLVYDGGGPAEVMDMLGSPMTYRSIPQAAEMINDLFADPAKAEALSDDLRLKASRFSREAFRHRVREALASRL